MSGDKNVAVSLVGPRWGTTGAGAAAKQLQQTAAQRLEELRKRQLEELRGEKAGVDQSLQEQRHEARIDSLAKRAVLAVREGLGELGEHLDLTALEAEFKVARPGIADGVNKVLADYVTARVPLVRASIQDALATAGKELAETKVSETVKKFASFVTALIPLVTKANVKNNAIFKIAAEQIFEASKGELLTQEVKGSLQISEPDEAKANELAKPILIASIQQKLEALVEKAAE